MWNEIYLFSVPSYFSSFFTLAFYFTPRQSQRRRRNSNLMMQYGISNGNRFEIQIQRETVGETERGKEGGMRVIY